MTAKVMIKATSGQSLACATMTRGVLCEEEWIFRVGDAIKMIDDARSQTTHSTVIKCWV